ncbi:unnamed protein product [Lymnaea stagnalis]|uniref:Protein sleepless n=1 Tax=Lymnaea stagnalis TaxID=6523 RepID=A0AAV2HJ30_LYMST
MNYFVDYHPWIALLLFLCIPSKMKTGAIQCFSCNSQLDSSCSSNSLDKFKTTCPENSVGCRKIVFFFSENAQVDLVERTVRQCAKTKNENGCKSVFGTNGKRFKTTVCECPVDFCNVGASIKTMSHLLCASVLATLFFLYF